MQFMTKWKVLAMPISHRKLKAEMGRHKQDTRKLPPNLEWSGLKIKSCSRSKIHDALRHSKEHLQKRLHLRNTIKLIMKQESRMTAFSKSVHQATTHTQRKRTLADS